MGSEHCFLISGTFKISVLNLDLVLKQICLPRPSDSPRQQAVTVFCFLLLVAQRIVNILVPWSLGNLVKALGYAQMPYKEIALYCLYRGLQGQQGIVSSVRAILWIPISQSLFQRLSCAAFEHVLNLSLDFHLSKQIGEVMSALSKGGALNTFLDGFAFQLFPMVFDLGVAAVYFAIKFDAFYAIIVIGVMWSYIFVTIYMAKYRGRARREQALKERQMEAAKSVDCSDFKLHVTGWPGRRGQALAGIG